MWDAINILIFDFEQITDCDHSLKLVATSLSRYLENFQS